MAETVTTYFNGQIVEEEIHLTLDELCQACGMAEEQVIALVAQAVLEPAGRQPQDWLFSGPSLRRGRVAARLLRDLDINPEGIALVLDLLDEINDLKSRIRRAGAVR